MESQVRASSAATDRWDQLCRQALDSSVDAYVGLDSGGRVLEWNRAASKTFGWSREEAAGRLLTELIVTADQRDWVLQDMRRYVATGRSPVVGQVSAQTMCRKDGTEVPVELTVNAVGSGPDLTFHAFIRDMTELSLARAAQRGTEATFQAAFIWRNSGAEDRSTVPDRFSRLLCRPDGPSPARRR